jgi:hypothetical protein
MTVFVAFVIGGLILLFTIWSVRFIASGPPPDPEMDDVHEVDVPFICTVCGMGLTITQAQDGDFAPPRHCREEMERA